MIRVSTTRVSITPTECIIKFNRLQDVWPSSCFRRTALIECLDRMSVFDILAHNTYEYVHWVRVFRLSIARSYQV